jgi:hypothetical protein
VGTHFICRGLTLTFQPAGSVLDAIKTGRAILPEVVRADTAKFLRRTPYWKETKEDAEKVQMRQSNETNPLRPSSLGPFIMDTVHRQAKKQGDQKRAEVEKLFPNKALSTDPHLTAPWLAAVSKAAWATREKFVKIEEDLEVIRNHVKSVCANHRTRMQTAVEKNGQTKKGKGSGFTDLPIEVRQDVLRASAKEFASRPLPEEIFFSEQEIATLRASYAYIYDAEENKGKGWSRFPWDVAMRELCTIKARALGPTKTVTEDFYGRYYMKRSSALGSYG